MQGGDFQPFIVKPGVVTDVTPWDAAGNWIDSDHIRFFRGQPQKMNGYTQYSNVTYDGTPRDLWAWLSNDGVKYMGLGTECLLYVARGGQLYDVTPIRTSVSANNIFSTSSGSPFIVVSVAGHGAQNHDYIQFSSFVTVGGVHLSGTYQITSVVGVDSFIVSAPVSAAATSASGGGAHIDFYLNCGTADNVAGLGWGTGTWGSGTWGTPRSGSGVTLFGRQWSMDNYGEILLANVEGGEIYQWSPSTSVTTHAFVVTAAPSICDSILVSDQDRHVFALGTTDEVTGVYDPLLLRWCSQENYNDWLASATNTAGSKRLGSGNYIVGGVRSKVANMIWTDNALYAASYAGPPFTFNIQQLGTDCGLIAKHAAIDVNGIVYWMGSDNFYRYDGTVRPLPCPVWTTVFQNLNQAQATKVFAGAINGYNEVLWLYPSKNSNECDRYVKFNWAENAWDFGTFDFSVWRASDVYANPVAGGTDGPLMYMEVSTTPDANGQPFPAFVKSAPMSIQQGGDQLVFVNAMIPNMVVSGTAYTYMDAYKYPGATTVTKGPYPVSAASTRIGVRARGRLVSLRVETSLAGESFRMGVPRLRLQPDGDQ